MLLQPISTNIFVAESSFFCQYPSFFWWKILILYTIADEIDINWFYTPSFFWMQKQILIIACWWNILFFLTCFNPLFVEPFCGMRHCRFRGHLGQHLAFGGPFLLRLFPWQWRESLWKNLDFGLDMAKIDFLGGEFRIVALVASDDSDWIFVHC